jgi:rhodanese-related sulfurtransferase
MSETATLGPQSALKEILEVFPGAQRALFRRYHIGGCSSCSFHPDETLEGLCRRNGNLDPAEVLRHLESSHQEEEHVWISAPDLARWLKQPEAPRLVDIRSREEFEAVRLPGSVLLSQPVMKEILAEGAAPKPLVIIDHLGQKALDAAAYFAGHGLKQTRCLRGGIDAWSREVDPSIRRYRFDPVA